MNKILISCLFVLLFLNGNAQKCTTPIDSIAFKNFKNVHLISVSAQALEKSQVLAKDSHDVAMHYAQTYLFMYFPEVAKK